MLVGVHESLRITLLAANKDRRDRVVEHQIRVGVVQIVEGAGVFIAHTEVESGGRGDLPAVFGVTVPSPVAEIHLGDPGLALLDSGETQKQAGKAGSTAVIEAELGGVAVGGLVVAAVLEKSPHRPDVATSVAAKTKCVVTSL